MLARRVRLCCFRPIVPTLRILAGIAFVVRRVRRVSGRTKREAAERASTDDVSALKPQKRGRDAAAQARDDKYSRRALPEYAVAGVQAQIGPCVAAEGKAA